MEFQERMIQLALDLGIFASIDDFPEFDNSRETEAFLVNCLEENGVENIARALIGSPSRNIL